MSDTDWPTTEVAAFNATLADWRESPSEANRERMERAHEAMQQALAPLREYEEER